MAYSQKMTARSRHSKGFRLLLLTAISAGIFFRFWNIDDKVYWIDEVHTSLRTVGYSRSEFVQQVPRDRLLSIDEFHQFQQLSPDRGWGDSLAALAQNAEHTPLYYLCTRLAMTAFGSSIAVTRAVAAGFSLLCLPTIYWCCEQLWSLAEDSADRHRDRSQPQSAPVSIEHISVAKKSAAESVAGETVGLLAVVLLSLSPLQVLYAQEARQYSLYALLTLVSSAMLLRSLRRQRSAELKRIGAEPGHESAPEFNSKSFGTSEHSAVEWRVWWPYAVSASLLLYSHLIGALVLLTQGIYVLLTQRRAWRGQLLSVAAALVSLLPWVALYFANASYIGAWTGRDIGLATLAQRWLLNLSSLWFDFQLRFPTVQLFDVEQGQDFAGQGTVFQEPVAWLSLGFLGLAIASLVWAWRSLPRQISSFLLLMVVLPSGLLLIPDLLSGGHRTGIARYLLPSYLGITIAVAYGLSWLLVQRDRWLGIRLSQWGRSLIALLLLLSLLSNTVSAQAETWWNKYSCFYDAAVAEQINAAENAIVLSSPRRASRLLALSYQLDAATPLWFVEAGLAIQSGAERHQLQLPEQFKTLFLFRPSSELVTAINQHPAYAIEPVLERGHLWQIVVVEPVAADRTSQRRCIELLS